LQLHVKLLIGFTHRNFTRNVSLDSEDTDCILEVIRVWMQIRNFLKDLFNRQDRAFLNLSDVHAKFYQRRIFRQGSSRYILEVIRTLKSD